MHSRLVFLSSLNVFILVMDESAVNTSQLNANFTDSTWISGNVTISGDDCVLFKFLFYTLLIGTLNVLGILGNILSIVVLQKDRNNEVAAFLLQSLAVADSLFLLISFFVLSIYIGFLPYVDRKDLVECAVPYLVKYLQPIGYMSQCGTVWITVLLAVNRFIAIVKPFLAPKHCTLRKARMQVASVTTLAILVNMPRFFQYNIIHDIKLPDNNQTVSVALNETSIGEKSLFGVIYTNILYTVIVLIVPLLILIVLNTSLVRELKCPRNSSRQSTSSFILKSFKKSSTRSDKPNFQRQNSLTAPPLPEEDNITFIMVIIILVLLVCHTPDRIFQIVRYFFSNNEDNQCGKTFFYMSGVCNLLLVLNSSTNFIVYYLLRKRFRKILVMKLCAWRNFKTYKEQPSYLEHHGPPPLIRRKTDSDMVVNGLSKHEHILDTKELESLAKVGSAPTLN